MSSKYPPEQYFQMATHIRAIAEAILEPDTRSMVTKIAEDYERMGRDARGAAAGGTAAAIGDTIAGTASENTA
jgi:hypothetical protein